MTSQVHLRTPPKNNNDIVRQILEFNSSEDEADSDMNLNQLGVSNAGNGNSKATGSENVKLSRDLIRLGKRPATDIPENNGPDINFSSQMHMEPAAVIGDGRYLPNVQMNNDHSSTATVSPSGGQRGSLLPLRAKAGILPVDSDDLVSISGDKRNRANDSVPNSPKRHRPATLSSESFVDLTASGDEFDEMPDNVSNGDVFESLNTAPVNNNRDSRLGGNELLSSSSLFGPISNGNGSHLNADRLTQNGADKLPSNNNARNIPEVIDLSDYSSTDNDDDDDEIEIIDVHTATLPISSSSNYYNSFNNGNRNTQTLNNNGTRNTQVPNLNQMQSIGALNNASLPSVATPQTSFNPVDTSLLRTAALELGVDTLKREYNRLAQQLIEKNTKKRQTADFIAKLKKNDVLLSSRKDPISKGLIATNRVQIQQYSRSYNDLVHETIELERKCEEKRRSFLTLKLSLERLKQLNNSFDNGYPNDQEVEVRNDPMAYNRAYQNAIMSQSNDFMMPPRGYSSNIYTDDNASLQSLLNNIKPDETYVEGQAKTPDGLGVSLLPHQRIGLAWLQAMEQSSNKGGILADDMGLGKTVQTLALMLAHSSPDPGCKTNLIVAPIALLKQWQQEILSKIKPEYSMRVFIYHQQDKLKTFLALKQYDVVLVSYNTLASEMKKHYASAIESAKLARNTSVIPDRESGGQHYKSPFYTSDLKFHRIILDEAQWVKNKLTQASKSVALLEAKVRWCLSGTPMQNSVEELYPLIRFLRIKPYNDEGRFRNDIFLPIKNASTDRYDSMDTSSAMRKLQLLLKAILLRRTKDAKIDGKPILQLPEKKLIKEDVEMLDLERVYYKSLEQHSAEEADVLLRSKHRGNYSSILTLLLRLRQLCCHKYLVELGDRKSSGIDTSKVPPSVIREMDASIVRRLQREAEAGFTCPICFDSVSNEKLAILSQCGHVLCQDCLPQFFEQFQNNGDEEVGSRVASCMSCRGVVKEKTVFNYDLFDMIFNKNFTDEQLKKLFTHDFSSNKKSDRRRNLLRLIEEDGGEFKSSLKIDICIKTIENILSGSTDEKVIVFSQFTLLFEVIRLVMDAKKIPFLQYDGSMNSDDRNATIGEFYKNPTKRVLLLSLKAGNVGLTLTCANHVIIMDPFWNPYVEEQAMDRAHRIGQQRPVHVHKLLIKDTIEDRILQLQDKKKEMINGALDSEGLSTISRLGRNEIRFLFGLGDLSS